MLHSYHCVFVDCDGVSKRALQGPALPYLTVFFNNLLDFPSLSRSRPFESNWHTKLEEWVKFCDTEHVVYLENWKWAQFEKVALDLKTLLKILKIRGEKKYHSQKRQVWGRWIEYMEENNWPGSCLTRGNLGDALNHKLNASSFWDC